MRDPHTLFTISHAAEAAALSVHQVRNYVGMRLVDACGCTRGGYRLFDQSSVARLQFIKTGLAAGLMLSEIAAYLRAREEEDATCAANHINQRIDQIHGALDAFTAQLQSIQCNQSTVGGTEPCQYKRPTRAMGRRPANRDNGARPVAT